MADTISSIFDITSGLTVEEMLSNPTYLPTKFKELLLDGQEAQKLFFRPVAADSSVIAWDDAKPNALDQEMEDLAEYAEIPIGDPVKGTQHTAAIEKVGIGIRVSWEQRQDNLTRQVALELEGRANTVKRREVKDAIKALKAAPIPELAAKTPWNKGGKPADDMWDAQEIILGAEEGGFQFTYAPDLLWIHPATVTALLRNEEIQKLYIGDMASENPLFKPLSQNPTIFGGIRIVKDPSLPKGEAWLAQEGVTGFCAEREPRQITDFYAEHGDSKLGGSNMSYRSDVVHRRAYGVDNPKSAVHLTGLMA